MKKFKQMSLEDKLKLEILYKQGLSLRKIAKVLNRKVSSIHYQLKQFSTKQKGYEAVIANKISRKRRLLSKKNSLKILLNKKLQNNIDSKLNKLWSPERISGYLKIRGGDISTKAIYKYVEYTGKRKLLYWGRRQKKKRFTTRGSFKHFDNRKYIDKRPKIESLRHFEIDFIASAQRDISNLMVIVDKTSKKMWLERVLNKQKKTINKILIRHCLNAKSITTDNDNAFFHWRDLEKILNTQIYFTHPFSSWEKGLVENTNRWLRIFFPKKTNFREIKPCDVKKAESYFNNIPRKILGFKTANQVELEERCFNSRV
jgi:IS30 family transposase